MRTFTANFSDLSGKTNPTGIWSPAFLTLKQALDRGDDPENVKQALYDWLSQKGVKAAQVDKLLDLKPEAAFEELVHMLGAKLNVESLPPLFRQTLRRTLARIAQSYAEREQAAMADQQRRVDKIKAAFVEGCPPEVLVSQMLGT